MENENTEQKSKNTEQDNAYNLYKLVCEISEKTFESEQRRQEQILEQSRTVQTVFSIISVVLITLVSFLKDLLENRSGLTVLTIIFYFIVFAIMVVAFIFSLLAQHRNKLKYFPDVEIMENTVSKNWKNFLSFAAQEKFKVNEFKELQQSLTKDNDLKVRFINIANILMLISTCLIFLFAFIITIMIYL